MRVFAAGFCVIAATWTVAAHSGPPFPIVTDRRAGPYSISIWTDPDATDDRTAGGQFWVVIEKAGDGDLPPSTRASVSLRAIYPGGLPGNPDRPGGDPAGLSAPAVQQATAEPVRGNAGNQFAALVMDHEGPYAVDVTVTGPLGEASVDARADATYDLRPPAYMLAWYLMPFVLAGLLWGRLLIRRRRGR